MIGFKIRHLACFLILFILATPLFADVIVIEKGVAGDLRWWNDQIVTRDDTIYFLGHKQNTSNELDYKLYVVDTKTDIKSDIVLKWEDGSPVRVPQNVAGFLDRENILLHWWEPGYYAEGNGAEVAGVLNIATGAVTKWQAEPAPAFNAAAENKTGIIADLKTIYGNGSYLHKDNFLLKQGIDWDGNARLYRYNTLSRKTEAANISQQYSHIIGFNDKESTMLVLWRVKTSTTDVFQYGSMPFDGTIQDINTFPNLHAYHRSYQHRDTIKLTGRDLSGQKRLYKYSMKTGVTSSSPFVDQSIQYDIYAINRKGEMITLWWDAAVQQEKYGVAIIQDNSTVTLTGGTTVNEDAGTVTLTATMANARADTVTVSLAANETGKDTALSPDDYSYDASIVIPPGSTTGTATVTIHNDDVHEPGGGEFFTISVSEVENAEESGTQTITITIMETDNDKNGLSDDWETQNNIYIPDEDPDKDGLTNLEEHQYNTDPNDPDSDDDGYLDKTEILYGMDPNVPNTEAPDPIVIYVKQDAQGDGSGKSWKSACTELFEATALYPFLLPGAQIWVAAGTYCPDTEGLTNPREAAFKMNNGIRIYGGFSGTETIFQERDPIENKSILSGDIGIQGDDSDNCYHVFYHPIGLDLDERAVLDGFIITGGNADGNDSSSLGGGMFNHECSPTLSKVVFKDNRAEYGGGLYNLDSEPLLTGCAFKENLATDSGGGVHNNNSTVNIVNSIFEANQAQNVGGGISSVFSYLSLLNCLFFENSSTNPGGAIDADESDIEIKGCTFSENVAGYNGGGFSGTATHLTLTGSIFWNNSPEEIKTIDGADTITYSNIMGAQLEGTNIDMNPHFIDPDQNDFSLQVRSPCINAGDESATEELYGEEDIVGNSRISGDRIDMGAFEYTDSEGNTSSDTGCFIGIISRAWFPDWYKK